MFLTDAQSFVLQEKERGNANGMLARLEKAEGVKTARYGENAFYRMPDKSRVIMSDPSAGIRLLRAAPRLED